MLATGPVLLSPDPRLKVEKHGGSLSLGYLVMMVLPLGGASSLVISGLTEQDAGDYVCQISLLGGLLSVQHSLDVLGEWWCSAVSMVMITSQ